MIDLTEDLKLYDEVHSMWLEQLKHPASPPERPQPKSLPPIQPPSVTIDVTEDLKLFRELDTVWQKHMWRSMFEWLDDQDWSDYPADDDPRLNQFISLKAKLADIALHSDAVTITDSTLRHVFQWILSDPFNENPGQDGKVLFDKLVSALAHKYHPNEIAQNLGGTRLLISPVQIPVEVENMISETRKAFSLGLPIACISLCKSTVERVIVDIAMRCGWIGAHERIECMGIDDRISLLFDRSVSHSHSIREKINAFMEATNNAIHSNTGTDMASAWEFHHDSLGLIEALYGQYKCHFMEYHAPHHLSAN